MSTPIQKVGIIGAGAWGTALACAIRRAGRDVLLWAHEAEVVDAINTGMGNPLFLPEIPLEPNPGATNIPSNPSNSAETLFGVIFSE